MLKTNALLEVLVDFCRFVLVEKLLNVGFKDLTAVKCRHWSYGL